jgi:biopolymer transport protein ExbB
MFWDHSLVELFHKGGFAMYPLLLCSWVGLSVILDRAVTVFWLGTNFPAFLQQYGPLVISGQVAKVRQSLAESRSPIGKVALAYLNSLEAPAEVRDKIVTLEASEQVARLEKRMSWLGMIASIATLLGLLGTVTGLVGAFHQIEIQGGHVEPGDLAAGIWEALITTVFGLVIAIPCAAAYHILDHRAARSAMQMEWITLYLEKWLHYGSSTADELASGVPGLSGE